MHFNPDGDLHPDRYSVGIWMRALKFMPLQHLPSFLFGMALGFLNEKIRPESRKRLAVGIFAFAALYLLLCVGDRLPYVMMHDGLLMPLFAGVILCLAGQQPDRAVSSGCCPSSPSARPVIASTCCTSISGRCCTIRMFWRRAA